MTPREQKGANVRDVPRPMTLNTKYPTANLSGEEVKV